MNLWVNFDLKFDPILQGKMAKISPKINKIETWLATRSTTQPLPPESVRKAQPVLLEEIQL